MNAPLIVTVLALASVLPAQGSFDLDKTSNGAIGRTQSFAFAQAPAQRTMLFMMSTTAGPLPLSLIDPRETRSLSVGLELAGLWFTVITGPGSGNVGIPIPNLPSLAGLSLHFQGLTFPGTTLLAGAMSNPVVQQLGAVDRPTPLPASLVAGRALAVTFRSGRDLVVAGGGQGGLLGASGLSSTEVFDGRTMQVRAGSPLTVARALACAVTLNDGRVLLVGGVDQSGAVLASAEIWDPATGTSSATGSMSRGRVTHDAVLLADGRVMVAGGTTSLTDALAALGGAQSSVEIWNPATGNWTGARAMPSRLLGLDLTRLQDGRVLASGGFQVDSFLGIPVPVGSVATARSYAPAANSWTAVGSMRTSRGAHGWNTVLLDDGRVLVTGGAQSGPDITQAAAVAAVETFDPATNTWTARPALAAATALHTATRLADGRVLVAGGAGGTLTAPLERAGVQRFVPATNTWQTLPSLVQARAGHGAGLAADGTLLLLGGQAQGGSVTLVSNETIRP